jgi:tRNA pseudouridine(38-40) synthase
LNASTAELYTSHGAGRTDAGVHALAQCAHVDVLKFLPAERWIKALNSLLPSAIRVLRCRYVSQDFHARLSAKGKDLSLSNLDRADVASIRISPCLAHRAASRFKDFEISGETLRRNS